MKRILPTLCFCLAAGTAMADEQQVMATLEQAELQHARAVELEHAWSTTTTLMDEARSALASGDVEAAQSLAERALLTANKAIEQAETERAAWRERALGG